MTLVNPYCSVADIKARLNHRLDDKDDAILEQVINAASREIDGFCARQFFQATATRYFSSNFGASIDIDDATTITTVGTDQDGDRVYEVIWAAADYDVMPIGASDFGRPYTSIELSPLARYSFPTQRKGVSVTGTWGWPSLPTPVIEATILQVIRLFKRKDAPYGVAGGGEMGMVQFLPKMDNEIKALLEPYRRILIGSF